MSRVGKMLLGIATATVIVGGAAFLLAPFGILNPVLFFSLISNGSPKQKPGQIRYTYQFTATDRYHVFAHDAKNKHVVVTFDSDSKTLTLYDASKGYIGSPNRSTAEEAFYVTYSREGLTPAALKAGKQLDVALYKCDPARVSCSSVFHIVDSTIGSALDFSDGNILFVGGKPELSKCGMFVPSECVRYRKLDLYVRRPDSRVERLTNWNLPELQSLSAAEQRLVFQNHSNVKTKVYTSVMSLDGPTIEPPDPFLAYGKNVDIQPYISPDGNKTAFLSSSESVKSSWRYDIVIAENASYKVLYRILPDPNSRLSPPIFIDANHIKYMSFDGERYKFWAFDTSNGKQDLLGEVTPADIQRAKVYDLAAESS